jgi:phage-related protein
VNEEKRVEWIASSLKDLRAMPAEVMREIGYALSFAQTGDMADYAHAMTGNLRDVVEIRTNDVAGTYRAMYTTTIGDVVYVLHVFQKKSHRGSATPQKDLDLIAQRLRKAREHHAAQTQS